VYVFGWDLALDVVYGAKYVSATWRQYANTVAHFTAYVVD
jgi:hypothetical protein